MSIDLTVNGKLVRFIQFVPKRAGKTATYYRDIEKKLFMKIPKNYGILRKEIDALKRLQHSCHFPKLLYYDKNHIVLPYINKSLVDCLLPTDILEQGKNIVQELKKAGINHRDIHLKNFMIKRNKIMLIDFGRAKIVQKANNKKVSILLKRIALQTNH